MISQLDPALFGEEAVPQDVRTANAAARSRLMETAFWTPDLAPGLREARATGGGRFPPVVRSPRARVVEIPGAAGPLSVRIIAPEEPQGIYLHFHGGGWYMGGADLQDRRLEAIADGAGLICISVDYRLSPEHPYPAAPDDCEAAARWVIANARAQFGVDKITIGGESSGATLATVTLIRLRDKLGVRLQAANLWCGFFDLALTPSARRFGDRRYAPRTHDLRAFVSAYAGPHQSLAAPDVSPLQADLSDLCPALFTIGTEDPLLDDSLFMHMRWIAARNTSELRVCSGATHAFELGSTLTAQASENNAIQFLKNAVQSNSAL